MKTHSTINHVYHQNLSGFVERPIIWLFNQKWFWTPLVYLAAYLAAACWFVGYKLPMICISALLKWSGSRYVNLWLVRLYRYHWGKLVGLHGMIVMGIVIVPLIVKILGDPSLTQNFPTWLDLSLFITIWPHLGFGLGIAFAVSRLHKNTGTGQQRIV